MLMYLGICLGNFTGTFLGDHFGRKPLFALALLLSGTVGMLAAFSPNYPVFAASMYVRGFIIGVSVSCLLLEVITRVGGNLAVFMFIMVVITEVSSTPIVRGVVTGICSTHAVFMNVRDKCCSCCL